MYGKSKISSAPPSAEIPSDPLFAFISSFDQTLLPLVMVYSAPGAPSVSCHPKGDPSPSPEGSASRVSTPWFGLSIGIANTRY